MLDLLHTLGMKSAHVLSTALVVLLVKITLAVKMEKFLFVTVR